jgi:hypothetical protein
LVHKFAVLKDTCVHFSAWSCESTTSVILALLPLALVDSSINTREFSISTLSAVAPLTLVDTSIRPLKNSNPVIFSADPISSVLGS